MVDLKQVDLFTINNSKKRCLESLKWYHRDRLVYGFEDEESFVEGKIKNNNELIEILQEENRRLLKYGITMKRKK